MNNKLIWFLPFLSCFITTYSFNRTYNSTDVQPFILYEIDQVARPYGFNNSFIIDRPYFAMIRNKADAEDVTLGSTMNACFFTGILYLFGNVPPYNQQDVREAMIWLRKAAYQGHEGARCTLGILHYHGTAGVPQDRKMAMSWFYRAFTDSSSRRASWLLARYVVSVGRYRSDYVRNFKKDTMIPKMFV
jgi:hypothetical protein